MQLNTALVQRLRDALVQSGRDAAPVAEDDSAGNAVALERFYPFAETLYLVMTSDEDADASERDAIRGAMHILSNGSLPDSALEDIFQRCRARIAERGVTSCLQEVGARLAADRLDRETAFTLAAAVALADGQLRSAESSLIGEIGEWFGISNRRAQALLQEI